MQAETDDATIGSGEPGANRAILIERGLADVTAVVFAPDAPALLPSTTGSADPAGQWRRRAETAFSDACAACAPASVVVVRAADGPAPQSWRRELGLPEPRWHSDVNRAFIPDNVDVPLAVGLMLIAGAGWQGRLVAVGVGPGGVIKTLDELGTAGDRGGGDQGGPVLVLVLGSGSACGHGPGMPPPRVSEDGAVAADLALAAALRQGDRSELAARLAAIDPRDARRWLPSGWAPWRALTDMLDPAAAWASTVDIVRPWGVDYPIGSWRRTPSQPSSGPHPAAAAGTAMPVPHEAMPRLAGSPRRERPRADPLVVAVVGPTATGKSDLAVGLARLLDGEIVNADALQLYRGMDIGTAKLTLSERKGVPHHQLDVLDVTEDANVASYQERARADINAVRRRGRRPLLVGGSGLYVRAVLDQIDFPGTDPQVRAALMARAEAEGTAALHAELAARDPMAAAQILPTNTRRIVRALEVIELTGGPFIAAMPAHVYALPAVQVAIDVPKDVLDQRIEARVDRMMAGGLIDEVTGLIDRGLRLGRTARHAVGYAEALAYIDGHIDLDEARARMIRATRRLARRQVSWFGQDHRVQWLAWDDPDLLSHALKIVAVADRDAATE